MPIIIGVGIVLTVFYYQLWIALDEWERDSNIWINQTQQKILYNSVLSQQLLEQYSFNQLQLHMVVMKSLLSKYQQSIIIQNPAAHFTVCSYRELMFNQCAQNVYDQLNENMLYADIYFSRSIFEFKLLTTQQQYFIEMNNRVSFYARASYLATQNEGLIQMVYFYNSDTTSLQNGVPSKYFNYTNADYQSCMGSGFIEPYDPRCRHWYTYAQQNQGFFIYEPYLNAVVGNLLMTLSSQVDYKNEFYSVDSIDFGMQNIVQLFNSALSENAYSVLIHEFNQTVFYHPMLLFYQVLSWADLEFININQYCSDSVELMQQCYNQKEDFSNQIDETIQFIKNGNYSIEDQFNLDQLYQRWERFGQKLISIIFPIKSQIKGFNNQSPYSYAILMTARVITDKSDDLKLFHLLNVNYIRIPLIIEFIILLILFLRRSYMEQQSCQLSQKIKNQIKQKQQTQQINRQQSKSFQKKSLYNKANKIKNDDSLNVQQQNDQSDNGQQIKINQIKSSQNKFITEEQQLMKQSHSKYNFKQIDDEQKYLKKYQEQLSPKINEARSILNNSNTYNQSQIMFKKQMKLNEFIPNKSLQSSSYNTIYQKNTQEKNYSALKIRKSIGKSKLSSKYSQKNDNFDYVQQLEFLQEKNKDENSQNQNSKDVMNTLFHFTKAKATFQQLKNQIGLSRCYFNLGLIYILKHNYNLAQEYFESSIILSLEVLGLDYLSLINQKLIFKQEEGTESQLTILCKRICSKAYSCKQYALQQIYLEDNSFENNYFFEQQQQNQQMELNVQKINYLLKNSLESYKAFFLCQSYQNQSKNLTEENSFNKIKCTANGEVNIINQIYEIQKSRQKFLRGLIEIKQYNYREAIEQFTLFIEEGSYYSCQLRRKAIHHLNQLFMIEFNKQIDLKKIYLDQKACIPYDITIIIQLEYQSQYSSFES
ncbi:tetratricopeptide repeat protein, partial (macronuclear) [Tetrahymena thermophila SB210]